MHLVNDFAEEIEDILDTCEKRMSAYPEDLSAYAIAFMNQHSLVKEKKDIGGLCTLLPFWLEDEFRVGKDVCRSLAVGNTFGLLYFFVQDEIIDVCEKNTELLLLSNFFLLDFMNEYRKIFSASSIFWEYFNRYFHEWAMSVAWEKKGHWNKICDYNDSDLLLLSRKAAPLKMPVTGMCILANKEEHITPMEKIIDLDQLIFQLIDDWRDWKEDLRNGNITLFLSKAANYCGISDLERLTEGNVRSALLFGNIFDEIYEIVVHYSEIIANELLPFHLPYIKMQVDQMKEFFQNSKEHIDIEKANTFKGGFDHLLTKIAKK